MIRTFRSRDTERLNAGERVPRFVNIELQARRRLRMLDSAEALSDLAAFPGNRLKPLKGERSGQFSIRINDQWRICFEWVDGAAENVEIVDYH